jgi:CHAT domain-containing protein
VGGIRWPLRPRRRYDSAVVRPTPLFRAIAALAPFVAFAAVGAARLDPSQEHALRLRAAEVFERRERARLEGGVSLPDLARALVAMADTLESAGLDSLASNARYRAAGVLVRLNREGEMENQLRLSIAAARRAGDHLGELTATSYLADAQVNRDPNAALETVHALIPRLQAIRSEAQLGAARSTEARAWMALGRARESLAAARRAAEHYRRAGKPIEEAYALGQQSQALRFLGRHREALVIADSTIALGRRRSIGRSLSRAYRERASCLRTLGRETEALEALDQAMAIDRQLGDVHNLASARRFKLSVLFALGRYRECVLQADSLLVSARGDRDPTVSLTAAMFRSGAFLKLGQPGDADTTLLPRIEAYEDFRRSLPGDEDRASTAEFNFASYAVMARSYLVRGRPVDAWRVSERGRAFALKERLGAPAVPDLDRLLARLAHGRAALIQYSSLDTLSGSVFLLAGGRLVGLPLRHDLSEADVRLARDRLSASAMPRADEPVLVRLGQALLADVVPRIPNDVQRLVIVPPNAASDLAFEALPTSSGREAGTLGERWAVSYSPAAGLLPLLDARRARGAQITALVDPEVSAGSVTLASLDAQTRGRIAQPLPNARLEGQRLARGGATVLAGRQATLERLDAATPSAVLHFATHAIEDPRVAPRGGLLLAGNPALLTPAAVESLDVVADLVSLSACRTLGSTSYRGEGAFGLARAFLAAGARTVVTTRWDVGDRAAARVMELFYDGLRAGLARDESLARAVRKLGREGFTSRDRWAFLLLGVGDAPLPLAAGRSRASAK